jgi:uncharacterized membrane protein
MKLKMQEKTQQQEYDENGSKKKNHLKQTLLTSPEGRILLIGVALAAMYVLWLVIKLINSPEHFNKLIGMTGFDIMFGRAAAMIFGYSQGLGHATVIPVCIIIETILVLLFYPLFVFSWRRLLVIKWLRNTFERVHRTAEAHKAKVQKYGTIGLFVFVWLPFWMTGPVVGCVIGFLLGLKARLNIPVVVGGTSVAIFGWAFFTRRIHDRITAYSSYAAIVILILLIVIIVVGNLLLRTLQKNKRRSINGR